MAKQLPPRFSGASSGATTDSTGSAGPTPITKEMVGLMIEAAEHKIQREISLLESSINQKLSRLDSVPTLWQIAGVVAAGFGIFLGVLAFAGDRFDGGIQFSTIALQQTLEAKQLSEKTAQQLAAQQEQMGRLLPLLTRLLEKQEGEKP